MKLEVFNVGGKLIVGREPALAECSKIHKRFGIFACVELPSFKHLYSIEAEGAEIEVPANNRAQAASFAKRAGYVVRSVNMIG